MKDPVTYPCLRSYTDWPTQDQLSLMCQRLGGWMSIRRDCVDYWVPEQYSYMLYLIDANLVVQRGLDYIV